MTNKFNVNETIEYLSRHNLTGKKHDELNHQAQKYNLLFDNHMNYLLNLISNLFAWDGLPESSDGYKLKSSFLEFMLSINGSCAYADVEPYGKVIVPCTIVGNLNPWGYPDIIRLVPQFQSVGNLTFYKLNVELNAVKGDKFVFIQNDNLRSSLYPLIYATCDMLTTIQMCFQANINQQKFPLVMYGNQDNKLSLEFIKDKFDSFEPYIFIRDTGDALSDKSEIFNVDAPFVADKLQQCYIDTYNNLFMQIGLNLLGYEKKERMLVDEVNSNNQAIRTSEDIYLTNRKEACERIAYVFGDNVTVKRNTEFIDALKNNPDFMDLERQVYNE